MNIQDLLNNNDDIGSIKWKGHTFHQITPTIQYNTPKNNIHYNTTDNIIFKAGPLKGYRREIVTNLYSNKSCNPRISLSVDDFNNPGVSIVHNTDDFNNSGIANTLDINLTTNQYFRGGINTGCNSAGNCLSIQNNALKRVRTSGVIKKSYSADTRQYLENKNKTFSQNQYNNLKTGLSTTKPGDSFSVNNVYQTNSINNCKKFYISQTLGNNEFSYYWFNNSNIYNVVIPDGSYDVYDLNTIFQNCMINNNHYYINNITGSKVFLLNITFNTSINRVILQTFITNTTIFPSETYSTPLTATWTTPVSSETPSFIIHQSFSNVIGFYSGTYGNQTSNQNYSGDYTAGVEPKFVKIYYKPSNYKYATQCGVTSSEQILRKRYETINTNTFLTPHSGSALSYYTGQETYNIKNKIGFPLPTYPKFNNNIQSNCVNTKLFNG
jgi:hypothetical protein